MLSEIANSQKFSSQISVIVDFSSYSIADFSIYKKADAIAIAGKTSPTNGTKIDGK